MPERQCSHRKEEIIRETCIVLVTHVADQEWNVMHGNETEEEEVQQGLQRDGLLSLVGEREAEVPSLVKKEAERSVQEVMIVIEIHQCVEAVGIGQADINGTIIDNPK